MQERASDFGLKRPADGEEPPTKLPRERPAPLAGAELEAQERLRFGWRVHESASRAEKRGFRFAVEVWPFHWLTLPASLSATIDPLLREDFGQKGLRPEFKLRRGKIKNEDEHLLSAMLYFKTEDSALAAEQALDQAYSDLCGTGERMKRLNARYRSKLKK